MENSESPTKNQLNSTGRNVLKELNNLDGIGQNNPALPQLISENQESLLNMLNEQDESPDDNESNNGTTRQPSGSDSGTGRRGSGAADDGFGGGAGVAHEQTKTDPMDVKEQTGYDMMKDLQSKCFVCNTKDDKNIDLNDAILQLMNQTFNIKIQSKYDKLICADCLELTYKVNGAIEARKLRITVCESLSPVKDSQQSRDLMNRPRRPNFSSSRSRSRSRSRYSTPPTPGEGIAIGSVCSSYKESDNES